MLGFPGRFLRNRSQRGRLPAPGGASGEVGVLKLSSASALVARALVVKEARMEDAETRRCHGSRALAAAAQVLGSHSLCCQSLERGGRENSPGRLCDLSRCVLHRQEGRGYGGSEGKDDAEIFTVGERVKG